MLEDSNRKAMYAKQRKAIRVTNDILNNSRGLSPEGKLEIKRIVFNSTMNKKPKTKAEQSLINQIKYHQSQAFKFMTQPPPKGRDENFGLSMARYHQNRVRVLNQRL